MTPGVTVAHAGAGFALGEAAQTDGILRAKDAGKRILREREQRRVRRALQCNADASGPAEMARSSLARLFRDAASHGSASHGSAKIGQDPSVQSPVYLEDWLHRNAVDRPVQNTDLAMLVERDRGRGRGDAMTYCKGAKNQDEDEDEGALADDEHDAHTL